MKYRHIFARNTSRMWDEWLMKQCHFGARSNSSKRDECVIKHLHIVVRNTGSNWDGWNSKLRQLVLEAHSEFGMTGGRNIATHFLGARAVYGMIFS
jgi:hypothetical protein